MLPFLTAPRLAQLALDLGVSAIAFLLAYGLRFERSIPPGYAQQCLMLLPLVLGLRFVLRFPFGLHRQIWRFVGLREGLEVVIALLTGSAILLVLSRAVYHTHVPWGVFALDWGINLVGYLALRTGRRAHSERLPRREGGARTRALLVGAGQAGNVFAWEIRHHHPAIELLGFVDDEPHKRHSRVQGLPVLGGVEDIPRLVESHGADEIIVCIPSATKAQMRRIMDACLAAKVPTKTLPSLNDLIEGKLTLSKIREVQIEDLLGRDPVEFDRDVVRGYLQDRVVLVTGAGGSIGSELCRQIAGCEPRMLLLLGRGENSVYHIEAEMRERFPELPLMPLIGDIRDATRMKQIFEAHGPQVVFHAAAHKHVPLMEANPGEAIRNNVFGTRVLAELADRHGVEAFVFISTDKAVNPTNVMGASKRAAELVVQALAARSSTRFMCVRFGNVLGSRGSVIPLFKRQIAAGGPITITHPEVIRYFMTIPEASQLVLTAGALGQGGEVFVLDMGDPVRIADLARDLIRLSGLEPEIDVPIRFTGLRPGEKLYEELLTAEEGTLATRHAKIFIARSEAMPAERLDRGLEGLESAAASGRPELAKQALQAMVTSYRPERAGSAAAPT